MKRSLAMAFAVLLFAAGCGEVTGPAPPLADEAGLYAVTAAGEYGLEGATGGLSAQALGVPAVKVELRAYGVGTPTARSRGVLTVSWQNAVPLLGGGEVRLENPDGVVLARFGGAELRAGTVLTTPYVYSPGGRLCVAVYAFLHATEAAGDDVGLTLSRRVCEAAAQPNPQGVLLARRLAEQPASRTTVELRRFEGVGVRAVVRVAAQQRMTLGGRACLQVGTTLCKRYAPLAGELEQGGVAEFASSYFVPPAGAALCARAPGVSVCESDGVELLRHVSVQGGIETTVTLLETPAGVLGRATFDVPPGIALYEWSEVEFVPGGEHESHFTLNGESTAEVRVLGAVGPVTHNVEAGPVPPGVNPCYSLGVAYGPPGSYPELLEMSGCVDPTAS